MTVETVVHSTPFFVLGNPLWISVVSYKCIMKFPVNGPGYGIYDVSPPSQNAYHILGT